MSYNDRSSSRLAAAALLAVSAGAVCGLALSFTPAASSLYAAPTAVRTLAGTRVAAVNMPVQMQAMNGQYTAEQYVPSQYATEQVRMAAPSTTSTWSILSGGVLAAAAAMVAILYKQGAQSSEQIAMLAASGKKSKSAPKAAASSSRPLWYPAAEAPAWLDGSLPGDRGFDPLGLSKPTEYLQFDLDSLDQNKPKNPAGNVVGRLAGNPDSVSEDAFQPYSEVFGLQRFRECELQHGRWAMLGALGVLVGEAVTGVAWQNAGLVEVTQGASYWGNPLPFTGSQITWFEVLTMGTVEVFRNRELNIEKRLYPGGYFDPLGLAKANDESTFRLKEAELKHGRLAMIAFLGFATQALSTGQGATQGFREWALSTWG